MLAENEVFVLFLNSNYSDEVFDEVNWLEDRILFAPEHQTNKIVFLLQLLVGFIFV